MKITHKERSEVSSDYKTVSLTIAMCKGNCCKFLGFMCCVNNDQRNVDTVEKSVELKYPQHKVRR
jgi:hypothetical protein